MRGLFLAAAEGGWKYVENDLRSEGAKLLDLDISLSTVLLLCGLMLVVVFFVGWNKYAYKDGRVREKAGYADDFITESIVGVFTLVMAFVSLRPLCRAIESVMSGGMFASFLLVVFVWITYALLALCVGYLGAGLKKRRVLRKKRIYNIRQMLWRIDQKSKF